mgnify:CR=1 FL=1
MVFTFLQRFKSKGFPWLYWKFTESKKVYAQKKKRMVENIKRMVNSFMPFYIKQICQIQKELKGGVIEAGPRGKHRNAFQSAGH